jgi:hypothetical protein
VFPHKNPIYASILPHTRIQQRGYLSLWLYFALMSYLLHVIAGVQNAFPFEGKVSTKIIFVLTGYDFTRESGSTHAETVLCTILIGKPVCQKEFCKRTTMPIS